MASIMKRTGFWFFTAAAMLLSAPAANGQESGVAGKKHHISFRDSLDRAFDMSDFLIDANGFIPVPMIITEEAVGGFGGAIVPVFIKKRAPLVGEHDGRRVVVPSAPDITGAGAFYTANKSWGVMGGRAGTFVKPQIRYRIGGGYLDMNLSFYRDMPLLDKSDAEFRFNIRMVPALVSATKRIGYSRWHAGLQYIFLNADVRYTGDLPVPLPNEFSKELDISRRTSQLGAIVEFDSRDNPFTPDKGVKLHVDANFSENWLGSDYDFQRINYYAYMYAPLAPKLVGGWRVDGQQSFGDVPFYMLPSINLRGVQAGRYQGKADILTEIELRWDCFRRWSVMGFSGTGKAFDEWRYFGPADWVWNYGTGFRYLLARKFGLRMGVDIAKGPGSWGYYLVFGSNWLR